MFKNSNGSWRTKYSIKGDANVLQLLKLDGPLFLLITIACLLGVFVLFSASNESSEVLIRQLFRISVAFIALLITAQLPTDLIRRLSPWGYFFGLMLLSLVLFLGDIGQGAQRWLDIGIRFQPSEIMKLAVPMMVAWYLHEKKLPPSGKQIFIIFILILIPSILIAKQPDLGTSLLVFISGMLIIFLAGIPFRYISALVLMAIPSSVVLWKLMQDYQRQRVITLLNPDSDPLGAGYNIIQSKIAIGSGGLFGKGWTNGSQVQLEFLPEKSTDFIFAVIGEEFGLLGLLSLLILYTLIITRSLYIASQAPDLYSRLLAGSISLTFFVYVFVNAAMVIGLMPIVGIPLPLISYGGTSMVTLMIGFGILMSISSNRKLLST
ncbi:MAG: rod shape-determining protein RodA [Woeseiaceae bacterium]|jgi:rod shape determining protein RodA|nr:rod shape-determining protein RodA [Woeseiaceae bacterium]|tara:strand:+ start:6680 stop:7813 length:1134 start_codon:yes stop_codon:yes gene_type:complete